VVSGTVASYGESGRRVGLDVALPPGGRGRRSGIHARHRNTFPQLLTTRPSPDAYKVQVGKSPTHTSYLWVYLGDPDHPYTVYDYRRTRGRDGPHKWLAGYRGFLQSDAYQGYNDTGVADDVVHLGCHAHARRKFYDARSTAPAEAVHALEVWRKLYAIEDRAREFSPEERHALRQAESKPILEELKSWLEEKQGQVLPKSQIGRASCRERVMVGEVEQAGR